MERPETTGDALDSVIEDLFSIMPLLARLIQRKLLRTTLSRIDENFSPAHFEITRMLQEAGTQHISEIGDELHIPRPQMTYLIDKLVSLNMVERSEDPSDRRMINISLTDKGQVIMQERIELIRDAFRTTISDLNNEELVELSASLRKLREIFSKFE